MFGYPSGEIIGQPILRILPPAHRAEESILIKEIKAGIRIQQFESVRIHKDGHTIQVSLTVSPFWMQTARLRPYRRLPAISRNANVPRPQ